VDLERFYDRVHEAGAAIHNLEPAPGFESVRLPGERQWESINKAKGDGVPVHKQDAEMLKSLATPLGINVPWE
jgi:LDH2 family malate/lactate/ureidoglycolate dehydrogenase